MDVSKLQQQISREGWARYWSAQAGTAGASVEKGLADVVAAFQAKHGKVEHVETPAEPGPQTQAALKVVAAIARARAGQVGEANGGSGRVFGNHKLPTYVVGGRS
jgi:hypothetical protein